MTNRAVKIHQILFVFTLIIMFLFMIVRSSYYIEQKYDNNVVFGSAVINSDTIKGNKNYLLSGTYQIIQDEFVEPDKIAQYEDKIRTLNVYDYGAFINGKKATIIFSVYNNSGNALSLRLNNFIGKYKIYVNSIPFEYKYFNSNENGNYSDIKYITLENGKKTDVVIHLRREDFFLFGFASTPSVQSLSKLITNYTMVQFSTIVFSVLTTTFSIFLCALSYLRSKELKDNKHVIAYILAGLFVSLRMLSVVFMNYHIIHLDYMDFYKVKVGSLVIIAYLLLVFTFLSNKQEKGVISTFKICTYVFIYYIIFVFMSPPYMSEIVYRFSLLFILGIQGTSLFTAHRNILAHKYNSIYTFTNISLFYIFVYSVPTLYLYMLEYNMFITYLTATTIYCCKIIVENYRANLGYKYVTQKQTLLNDMFNQEVKKTKRLLEIANTTKSHAIRISEEGKKRDIVTGLYNRHYTTAIISDYIKSLKNSILPLLIIDIDNLKYINDAYGNETADSLLVEITTIILSYKKQTDLVSRWAGGTFLVILPTSDIGTAKYISEAIRRKIEKLDYLNNDTVTVTIGVTSAKEGSTFESTERSLNSCLEIAKNMGRNCIYIDPAIETAKQVFTEKSSVDKKLSLRNPYTGELF